MGKENQLETTNCGVNDHDCPPVKNEELAAEARYIQTVTRVCQPVVYAILQNPTDEEIPPWGFWGLPLRFQKLVKAM